MMHDNENGEPCDGLLRRVPRMEAAAVAREGMMITCDSNITNYYLFFFFFEKIVIIGRV